MNGKPTHYKISNIDPHGQHFDLLNKVKTYQEKKKF